MSFYYWVNRCAVHSPIPLHASRFARTGKPSAARRPLPSIKVGQKPHLGLALLYFPDSPHKTHARDRSPSLILLVCVAYFHSIAESLMDTCNANAGLIRKLTYVPLATHDLRKARPPRSPYLNTKGYLESPVCQNGVEQLVTVYRGCLLFLRVACCQRSRL